MAIKLHGYLDRKYQFTGIFKLDLWKKPLWRHLLMSIENSFKKGITMSKNNVSRLQLINQFESAPESTLFNQNTLAAVLDCSVQLLERNRWAGQGVPYLKIGRTVRYRKSDILNYLQQQCTYNVLQDAV
ncbi:Uncharacterised protein [Legionella pneumophila]|nr:Uncharacterised protein [Legionella pneumophila]CZI55622.1 Uncharacterised protein [Legionella pneumophila]CZJ01395.1 Uncharacterised protein [Legionella pneumophila]SNV94532.1 Uncharacterised protein [Legionella pneumophila]SQG85222.1 Uncharacterised protein [Legionella pneumophila]